METAILRNIWCAAVELEDVDALAPKGYTRAEIGTMRSPGYYGEGFAGEALVCLLPGDDGEWYVKLAIEKMKVQEYSVALTEDNVERMRRIAEGK